MGHCLPTCRFMTHILRAIEAHIVAVWILVDESTTQYCVIKVFSAR